MKKSVLVIAVSLPLITLMGCVSTKVFSLKDPSYAGRGFTRVLIFGDFSKIEYQENFEDEIADDLRAQHVFARSSYQLLPPLRTYSDSEKVAIFKQNGFDCYMIVSSTGTNTQEYHVPTYTSGNVAVVANSNSAYGSGNSVTTGGYSVNQVSSMDFQCELFDFSNGKLVCRAQATTDIKYNAYGQTWASMGDVVSSACSNLADEFIKDGLFYSSKF